MKSVKSLNRSFWATEYWLKALKFQIWLTNTKPFFRESQAYLETLQKRFSYIWVSYKFLLKSVKSLNWIFCATEYWCKALKCQIWLTNTKPFYWECEENIETLQKLSPHIEVTYKLGLEPGKNLSWLWLFLFRIFSMLNMQLSINQLEIMLQNIYVVTMCSKLKTITWNYEKNTLYYAQTLNVPTFWAGRFPANWKEMHLNFFSHGRRKEFEVGGDWRSVLLVTHFSVW